MANSTEQAWQWLTPPVVADSDGKLLPRRRGQAGALVALSGPAPRQAEESLESPAKPWLGAANASSALPEPAAVTAALRQVAPMPELLVHPQANQQMQLKGRSVQYLLRRSSRRSIGFSVGLQGLVVTSPQWVSLQETQAALHSKADWIVDKLQELQHRGTLSEASRVQWQQGGQVDFLGQALCLCLQGPQAPGSRQTALQVNDGVPSNLYLPVAQGAAAAQVRAAVKSWMLREARSYFVARLRYFAPIVGVQWRSLRLTSARTRWGSANTDGVIRLNWRLMQHDPAVIDYVVVHELAHLHHMDHSPQFWAVVASVLPGWKQQRQVLKVKLLAPWE